MRIAQDVWQRSATGMGTFTDQKQVQKFAQSVCKLQFIIYQPHLPSWQLLPLLAFSRLHFFHSSWNSCLLRRLSQPFVPADTGSRFSNLSGSLALTSLSQGLVSKCRPDSASWYFLLGCSIIFCKLPSALPFSVVLFHSMVNVPLTRHHSRVKPLIHRKGTFRVTAGKASS